MASPSFIRREKVCVLKDVGERKVSTRKLRGKRKKKEKTGKAYWVDPSDRAGKTHCAQSGLCVKTRRLQKQTQIWDQFKSCPGSLIAYDWVGVELKESLFCAQAGTTVVHPRGFTVGACVLRKTWPSYSELLSWVHQDQGKERYLRGLQTDLACNICPVATFCGIAWRRIQVGNIWPNVNTVVPKTGRVNVQRRMSEFEDCSVFFLGISFW